MSKTILKCLQCERNAQITFVIIFSFYLLSAFIVCLCFLCEFRKCSSASDCQLSDCVCAGERVYDMAEVEYESGAVAVSSQWMCSIVSNEHLVSHTCMTLYDDSHWIEVTMFGSSAICTSKSFDNTCDATQMTHSSLIFRFSFIQVFFPVVDIVNNLWLLQWKEVARTRPPNYLIKSRERKKNRRLVHGEPRRMEKIERDRVMGINDIGKMVQNKNLLNLPLEWFRFTVRSMRMEKSMCIEKPIWYHRACIVWCDSWLPFTCTI